MKLSVQRFTFNIPLIGNTYYYNMLIYDNAYINVIR